MRLKKNTSFPKVMAWFLSAVMLLTFIPIDTLEVSADTTAVVWDGTIASQAWESGMGTEDDPYIIMTSSQLAKLADDVNSGIYYADTYFKLGADLDLNGSACNWTPIGGYHSDGQSSTAASNAFAGVFDGNDKTIFNMKSDGGTTNYAYSGYRGLFGNLSGTVKNLKMQSPYARSTKPYAASVVAYSEGGTVSDVTVLTPTIAPGGYGANGIGGVIGYMKNGTVKSCTVQGGTIDSIAATQGTGGIVGYADNTDINDCKVTNTALSAKWTYLGGIVGYSQYGDVVNCVVTDSTITSTNSSVGGVVGYIKGTDTDTRITVKNCGVSGGSVTGASTVGGIVGQTLYANVSGCYNIGAEVAQTSTSTSASGGGIIGVIGYTRLFNCFSAADVTAPASTRIGAIFGNSSSSSYGGNAHDATVCTAAKSASSQGTTGYTTEEIKSGAAAYKMSSYVPLSSNAPYVYLDWGQRIGTEDYPVFNTEKDASLVVYGIENNDGTTTYYNAGGAGAFDKAEDGYYEIASANDWYRFARVAEKDSSANARLVADIDFAGVTDLSGYVIKTYSGIFEGKNFTVKNIEAAVTDNFAFFTTIEANGKVKNFNFDHVSVSSTTNYKRVSLISDTNNGHIENISVSNSTVNANYASIFTYKNNGIIKDSEISDVHLTSKYSTGAFASTNYTGATIENCKVLSGTVTIYNDSTSSDVSGGGLVGQLNGGTMKDCANAATVSVTGGRYTNAGGIAGSVVGSSSESAYFLRCSNTGSIFLNDISSNGPGYAGGITGGHSGSSSSSYFNVEECYNTGSIKAEGNEYIYASGIAGKSGYSSSNNYIKNCYNSGTVTNTSTNKSRAASGIAYTGNAQFYNCLNVGAIFAGARACPIIGTDYNSEAYSRMHNCYSVENCLKGIDDTTVLYGSSYYGNNEYDKEDGVTVKELADGSVLEWLNSGNETAVWGQIIGTHDHPVLISNDPLLKAYKISASVTPAEGGSVTGGGSYIKNASVTLSAVANSGYAFLGWMENGAFVENAAAMYTFDAAEDRTLVAVFAPVNTITVDLEGGELTQAAVDEMSKYDISEEEGVLSGELPEGFEVELKLNDYKTYINKTGYVLVGFTDGVTTYTEDIKITVSEDKNYTLIWKLEPYRIKNTLTGVTTSNTATEREQNETENYAAVLSVEDGYILPDRITVKVAGVELSNTDYIYDFLTGELRIEAEKITGNLEIICSAIKLVEVTFDVSDTEYTYETGVSREINFTPSDLTKADFKVSYYLVNENSGMLYSVTPEEHVISAGKYLYVIDFATKQPGYRIVDEFEVTSTNLPTEAHTNCGYMIIKTAASSSNAQQPIYFEKQVVNATMTDEVENVLTNPNSSIVTYESKNTDVAVVDENTGEVAIKGTGSAVIVATSKMEDAGDVYASYTLYVTKEVITVSANDITVSYGTEKSAIINGYTVSKSGIILDGTVNYAISYDKGAPCGLYNIEVSGLTSDIYEIVFEKGILTVIPKEITLTDLSVNANDKVYDGSVTAALEANIDTGLVPGDIVNVFIEGTFESADVSDAGKTISYTVTGLSGTHSSNYKLVGTLSGTTTAKITKAPVTISVPAKTTYIYDGEDKIVNVIAYANGSYFDKFNVIYTKDGLAATPNEIGTYAVGVEITDPNYELDGAVSAELIIKEAQQDFFTIEGINDNVTYGDPVFYLQADGVETGATVKYAVVSGDAATVTESGMVTITGVGSVTVEAVSTLPNHNTKTVTRTFTVKPKTINITAVPETADKVYDGTKNVSVKLILDGVVGTDDIKAEYTDAAMVSADVEANKTVFVNGITISGNDADLYQLSASSVQTSVNVIPIEITDIKFKADNKVYNGNAKAEYQITGLTGVLDSEKDFVTVVGTAFFEDEKAGIDKTVTLKDYVLSGSKSGNYTLNIAGDVTTIADIEKATVDFTLGTLEYTYDGNTKTVPVYATVDGLPYTDYTVVYHQNGSSVETKAAGDYDVVIVLNDTENYKTNYTTKTLKIVKASQNALTITGLIGTIDYGATFALTAVGGSGEGSVTWATSDAGIAEVDENTGVVTINGTGAAVTITATKAADGNHNGPQTAMVTFTPSKKSVGFKVTDLNQTYDGNAKSVTVVPSVGTNNYIVTYTDENGNIVDQPTNAGVYYVDVNGKDHYEGYASAVLTIKNATVDITNYTFSVADKVYGEKLAVTKEGTLPEGVSAVVTYMGNGVSEGTVEPENAGSYVAKLTISGDNFDTVVLTDEFEIAKAVLYAKPDNAKRVYGEQNPAFAISYYTDSACEKEIDADIMIAPAMTTTATADSRVGDYEIAASGGYAENYTFIYVPGTLTIEKTSVDNFYIYGGQSSPSVDDKFTLTAYYNSETPAVSWVSDNEAVATVTADGEVTILKAGTAKITATIVDTNYNGESAEFELTAAKKRINIKIPASELVKTYNGQEQKIRFTSNDIDLEEKGVTVNANYVLTSDSSVTSPVQAGTYTVSYEVDDERYIADGNTTFTINKVKVVVKAKDITKVYGDDPEYELEIVSGSEFATVDDIVAFAQFTSDGAAKTASAGTYDILVTLTKDNDDNRLFTVHDTKGVMTVEKAPLTITVKDVTREYGAENPSLEVTYEGFKNEENENTENIFTGELVLTYDESVTSELAVGEYTEKTTASGIESANYEIVFMPGKVIITPSACKGTDDCPSLNFADLDVQAWYHLDTDYVIENEIFKGVTEDSFAPYEKLSRAMLVTILYRIEGEPEADGSVPFADVDRNAFYGNAVSWAKQNGIVNGYENGYFGPADNITREQMAVMMYRYASYLEKDTANDGDLSKFTDGETVSPFATDALKWAVAEGIITGKGDADAKALDPQGETARCEAAAIIRRFMTTYAE